MTTTKRGQARALPDSVTGPGTHLTRLERALLQRMLSASGDVVERDVLLQDVFGYRRGTLTHTLETHIWRLRRKIEADPGKPQKLISGKGGYRLIIRRTTDAESNKT